MVSKPVDFHEVAECCSFREIEANSNRMVQLKKRFEVPLMLHSQVVMKIYL